ncbi:MAG: Asp-tRNA(Asn)/Glu-tRNA(Gln) amidotransferase subunit GatA [Acidobacteriota bacterium]
MPSLTHQSIADMRAGLEAGEFSCEELTRAHLERIDQVDDKVHAFLHVDAEGALERARAFDGQQRKPHGSARRRNSLAGIPLALKDIFCTRDMPTTCGSRLLAGYCPPYDATLVQRLRRAGAILVGKTNMDEFAMGSSCENSAFGPTHNPLDLSRVPGGSSGGSAAAVAAREIPGSYGTDTGGSVRQPAAFCGIVGLKPTYGRISRYGMVAFASSLDQAGPLARSVEDLAILLDAVWGPDHRDATTSSRTVPRTDGNARLNGLVFGLPREYAQSAGLQPGVERAYQSALARVEEAGGRLSHLRLPHTDLAIPTYYLLATAEASANLARYDGVRYGRRPQQPGDDLAAMYEASRSEGFGEEVQRRIMLGTFALSAGYQEAFYGRAQRVRTLIRNDFALAFQKVDLILTPTAPGVAFALGEKVADPLSLYQTDLFTVPASLAGLPALSLPCGSSEGLPVGLQIIAPPFHEERLLQAARGIEKALDLAPFHAALGG